MQKASVVTIVASIIYLLVGQVSAQEGRNRTVTWYLQHEPERNAMTARCEDDPGRLQGDPDCVNAAAAKQKAANDKFFGGGPIKPPPGGFGRF